MSITAKKSKVGKLRRSSICKMMMVIVYLVSILAAGGGTVLSIVCIDENVYTTSLEQMQHDAIVNQCHFQIDRAYQAYLDLKNSGYFEEDTSDTMREGLYQQYMLHFNPEYTNFFFKVETEENEELLRSADMPYQYEIPHYYPQSETYTEIVTMTREEYDAYDFSQFDRHEIITEYYTEPETSETSISTEPVTTFSEMPTSAGTDMTETMSQEPNQEGVVYPEGMSYSENVEEISQLESEAPVQEPTESENPLYFDVRTYKTIDKPGVFITGYVKETLDINDTFKNTNALIELVWNFRYAPFFLVGGGVIAFVLSLWFLLLGAGYHSDNEEAALSTFDRIPFDLFTGLHLLAGICLLVLLGEFMNVHSDIEGWIFFAASILFFALMFLFWLMSTAVRIRTNTLWKNNLITFFMKSLKKSARRTSEAVQALPVIWQAPAAVAGFFFLQFIGVVLIIGEQFIGIALLIMLWCLGMIAAIILIINMHYLEKGAEKLAKGELQSKINERDLYGPFRRHAVHLNSIGDGMNKAVGERLKSETFKSELIANVSHDIRTPLTSIINYTDLLAKLELQDPQAQEYIDVLQRQSARLRKLTEDVLEASKASTGNLTVERGLLDLQVLLEQMLGEYAERLEARRLEMVCTLPDHPLYIMADGRLMWRVMDNLFGNICKYAMEGTRVYLNASVERQEIQIVLRNISGTQLNISAEALMERFVRGDRSRNTEGSGLGLSIAQSLTELQGGSLKIEIDGDLFKVTLRFPQSQKTDSK